MKFDRRIIAGCAAALLFSASAAFADDAKPAEAPAAPAAPAATPAAPAATPAAPAATTPAPAAKPATVPAAVQAWAKFCDAAADGHKVCIVRKLVFQGTSIIASVSLRIDSAKGVPTLAVAAVPVGVVLKPGLLWQIDKQKATVQPYWRCTPQNCESEQLVKADFINQLRKGTTLTLVAKDIQNKNIVIPASLSGFSDAFDKKDAPTFAEYNKALATAK